MIHQRTFFVGICQLVVSVLSYGVALAAESIEPSPDQAVFRQQINELGAKVAAIEAQIDDIILWAVVIVSVATFIGYTVLRNAMRSVVERRLEHETVKAVEEHLPRLLHHVGERAENDLLRVAQLLALRSSRNFDEALEEFRWTGDVTSLREDSVAVRRAVIDCLWGAKKNRASNRRDAWEAVTELAQEDITPESLALYLRLAISHRRFQDGIDLVERHSEVVSSSRETALRAATLFRQVGRLERARDLAQPHADLEDLHSLVTLNSIQRDLGNFDEVHDSLLPAVERLSKSPSTILPHGWHRILNTFVANCIDRGRPEDAVGAAEFVMRSSPGPVEVFTVGRLVLALPQSDPKRVELQTAFEVATPNIHPEAEAATRCEALLARMNADIARAEAIFHEAIDRTTRQENPRAARDEYYARSALAELLIDRGAYQEAIDELTPTVGNAFGGEAKFNLARAYALAAESGDAARWLKEAIKEAPKWAARARDDRAFRGHAPVADVLAAASTVSSAKIKA